MTLCVAGVLCCTGFLLTKLPRFFVPYMFFNGPFPVLVSCCRMVPMCVRWTVTAMSLWTSLKTRTRRPCCVNTPCNGVSALINSVTSCAIWNGGACLTAVIYRTLLNGDSTCWVAFSQFPVSLWPGRINIFGDWPMRKRMIQSSCWNPWYFNYKE